MKPSGVLSRHGEGYRSSSSREEKLGFMFPSLIYDGTTFREESAVLFSSFELRESVISELKFHSGRIMSRGESEGVSE